MSPNPLAEVYRTWLGHQCHQFQDDISDDSDDSAPKHGVHYRCGGGGVGCGITGGRAH